MLDRRTFLLAAAASAALPNAAQANAPLVSGAIDLMADFWPVYDRTRQASDRVAQLQTHFFTPHAREYEGAGIKLSEARVAKWLPQFDAIADDVRVLWQSFARTFQVHTEHFGSVLPDFDAGNAPVYAMPSLFGFDGHLQPWEGKVPLFLGLDGIVHYHGARPNLAVLLDHESFHLYQAQVYPAQSMDEAPPIFAALWIEGCATYVAQQMNPTASRQSVLLDDDGALSSMSPETLWTVVSGLLAVLESRAQDDFGRYFYAGQAGPIPSRSGYLVGLILAERIGTTLTPMQMARIPNEELVGMIRKGLQELAAG